MKKLILVLVIISCTCTLHSQVKIDVKTQFNDKRFKSFQAVKLGMIEMMKRVSWLKVGEVGEKYSLWIDNLKIIPDETDKLASIISFDIELRTPAMFTHGKQLQTEHISFKVNMNDTLPVTNPPVLERYLKHLDEKSQMSSLAWVAVGTAGAGLPALAKLFVKVGGMMQSDFTPADQTMGLWAGYYSLDAVYTLLKKQGEF